MSATPADLGRAWTAHLVAGGTSEWAEFGRAQSVDAVEPGAPEWDGPVPGVQNLELLRRVNLVRPATAKLVHEILGAGLPGRGRPDLLLPGATPPRWGHPPVAPQDLAADELLRVAGAVLADRLAAVPLPEPAPRRVRRWSRQYVLHGDPWWRDDAADRLRHDGRPAGGPAAHHLVLAAPVDRMLISVWLRRAFGDGVDGFAGWLEGRYRSGRLPARVDLVELADRAAAQVGVRRTHVVLDPAALAELSGMRRLPAPAAFPTAAGAEVARRIGTALGIRVPIEQRRGLVWQVLRPALVARSEAGPRLQVPQRYHAWLVEMAESMIGRLRRRGYPVHGTLGHGDLNALAPSPAAVAVGDGKNGTVADAVRLAVGLVAEPGWPGRLSRTDREVSG